ncbi:MAG: hypothetical protein EHM79_14700 [Geobacter sp.]|nr:MAG: hypothetical protein EHM79_14700 [Geobacter sp.]
MTKDILKFEEYFPPGMRIQVEIPLPEEKPFRDDAEILSLHQDLLELRLSRIILPAAAILEIGTPLYVRTGKKGAGFRSRGILLKYDSLSSLFIRLTGEVLSINDREYFRIDVYIPLKYRLYCDGDEREAKGEGVPEGFSGDYQRGQNAAVTNVAPEKPLPVAANLSGAGVRVHLPDRFDIDQLLELTLFLPPAFGGPMTLPGLVVYVMQLGRPGDARQIFDTAIRFVNVDEPHRDNLLKFIHAMQLEQLRRLREHSSLFPSIYLEKTGWGSFSFRKKVLLILCTLSVAFVVAWLVFALAGYYSAGSKGEIAKTFEDQIRKFINQ